MTKRRHKTSSRDDHSATSVRASSRNAVFLRSPQAMVVLGAVFLLTASMAAYWPAIQGGFVWDDDSHLTAEESVRDPAGLAKIWFVPGTTVQYQPLVFSSFWLEYRLWGSDDEGEFVARGFHVTNVVLHVLVALLVWRVLQQLQVPGAYFAALVFALHPVNVESVAWITERKNVLSGVFYMLALLAYMRFCPMDDDRPWAARRIVWYILATVLFIFALLAKTVTCSLPAVMLLLMWWKRERVGWRDPSFLIPWFAAGLLAAGNTAWIAIHHVGAVGEEWNLTVLERLLVAGRALWFYAGKLVLPVDISFVYPRWDVNTSVLWQYVFPIATVAVVVGLWLLRGRIGRGPLAAVLIFAGTLVPALGFFRFYYIRYSFVADHFQYLASLALISLFVAVVYRAAQRLDPTTRGMALAASCLIPVVLFGISFHEAHRFKDPETLWLATLEKNDTAWMVHNNLAGYYVTQARVDEAMAHYRRSIELRPDHYLAIHTLGTLLASQGKYDEAIRCYERALEIKPDFAHAHARMGSTYAALGNIDEAIAHFRRAIELDPKHFYAIHNFAGLLASQGKTDEAIRQFQRALEIQPNFAEAHIRLGAAYVSIGNAPKAVEHYRQALKLVPERVDVMNDLAWILATHRDAAVRDGAEAVRLAERARSLTHSGQPAVFDTLAAAYAEAGRFDDAVNTAQKAIALYTAAGQTESARRTRQRCDRYKSRQSWREEQETSSRPDTSAAR